MACGLLLALLGCTILCRCSIRLSGWLVIPTFFKLQFFYPFNQILFRKIIITRAGNNISVIRKTDLFQIFDKLPITIDGDPIQRRAHCSIDFSFRLFCLLWTIELSINLMTLVLCQQVKNRVFPRTFNIVIEIEVGEPMPHHAIRPFSIAALLCVTIIQPVGIVANKNIQICHFVGTV